MRKKKNYFIISVLILVAVFLGLFSRFESFFVKPVNQSSGVSAKQWFNYVEGVAKKWRQDACLYGILDSNVSFDGKSNHWSYLFYSAESGKSIIIEYNYGFITQKEQERNILKEIKKWEFDSPMAVQLAMVDGGGENFVAENSKVSVAMSLISYPDEPKYKNKTPYWQIKFYGDNSVLEIMIDVVSGKVVNN